MPDWAMHLLVAGGGLTALIAAVGKLFNVLSDAWKAMVARNEAMHEKVESLLHDAVAREKEFYARMSDRAVMDAQTKDLIAANTAALTKFATLLAKPGEKP